MTFPRVLDGVLTISYACDAAHVLHIFFVEFWADEQILSTHWPTLCFLSLPMIGFSVQSVKFCVNSGFLLLIVSDKWWQHCHASRPGPGCSQDGYRWPPSKSLLDQWIAWFVLLTIIHWIATYPLDNDLSGEYRYPAFEEEARLISVRRSFQVPASGVGSGFLFRTTAGNRAQNEEE